MKQLFNRLLSHTLPFDSHARMAFFEAMWLILALLMILTAAHQPASIVRITGLIAGTGFAILMAIGSYSSFVQWHRPQPPFDENHFKQAVQYLIDLGLPESLSHAMVKQEWEEEKYFAPRLTTINDEHVLHHLARRMAFRTLSACLIASVLMDVCYWITGATTAVWLSLGVAFLFCIILQVSPTSTHMWRWLFLLIFVSGSSLLAGHIFHIAG